MDPIVDPTEPTAEPAEVKVTFDDVQKTKIADIVRAATSKARADAARLQSELDAVRKAALPPAADDVLVELATTRAERDSLRSQQREAVVTDALRAAIGSDFLDAELACSILKNSVRVVDGKPVVLDAAGEPRFNSSFAPMTVGELASELAASKPFLAREKMLGGSGSVPSRGTATPGPDLRTLFGKGSSGESANKLALHNPKLYKQLRTQAIKEGLIG
jgi:hypothetical protein